METSQADCQAEALIEEGIQKKQLELAELAEQLLRLTQELAFKTTVFTQALNDRKRNISLAKLGI